MFACFCSSNLTPKGSDPAWFAEKNRHYQSFLRDLTGKEVTNAAIASDTKLANGDNRFKSRDELKYSLRSIEKFAPWVRHIHIVVADGQVPSWLNSSHPKIRVVPHSAIFRRSENLPTFNSYAIESHLSEIPDLADYALYFNDDVFLGNNVNPSDMFVSMFTGEQKRYEESWSPVKTCAPGCSYNMLQNSNCDVNCNVPSCNWDFGDCGGKTRVMEEKARFRSQLGEKKFESAGDFWATVLYADGVLNREFQLRRSPRNVIKHVPYFFNKRMMKDMHDRLRPEFDWNDSHRFRHPEGMLYPYVYMHYLSAVKVYAPTEQQAWLAAFDTVDNTTKTFLFDHDLSHAKQSRSNAVLDPVELARKNKILKSPEYSIVKECTIDIIHDRFVDALWCVRAMKTLIESLRLPFGDDSIGKAADVEFVMMRGNDSNNIKDFSRVARDKKKFITINDDMNGYQPITEDALQNMYLSFFPSPSSFEL